LISPELIQTILEYISTDSAETTMLGRLFHTATIKYSRRITASSECLSMYTVSVTHYRRSIESITYAAVCYMLTANATSNAIVDADTMNTVVVVSICTSMPVAAEAAMSVAMLVKQRHAYEVETQAGDADD